MYRKISGLRFPLRTAKWNNWRLSSVLCCFMALFFLPFNTLAQTKKELEDKRKKMIRDIATTEKMIRKTKQNKEATYDRFVALQNQIVSRGSLIETLNIELNTAEEGILRNQDVIASLERDIANMRTEYARTIRNAFRQKTISNPLLYILSAESLNQAFRRWLFLRKYDQRRHEEAAAIVATQEMLARKVDSLKDTRLEKESLLLSMQGQEESLKVELIEKDKILQVLSKDESRLKADLIKKQAEHEMLNRAIENIITEQVRKKAAEARKPKPLPSSPVKKLEKQPENTRSPEKNTAELATDEVSLGFAKNRGRLPWPVESGFIARAFGRQKHPTLKNIEITNNGVDIRTEEHAVVHAVFEGRVAGTQFIPGHDYTVILQHGDYYTVYSNLAETTLVKGDNVRAQQNIGTVSYNTITGSSELHFELWHDKERINPSGWIKK